MDDLKTLQDALYSIKPSDLTYEEWLNVGMALKDEGLPCDLWDDWSRSDTRYENGICSRKWDSFAGSGVGVGTIFHYAETYGHWTRSRDLDWDDAILESDYYHEVLTNEKKEEEPWEMAVRYLEIMFHPDETVSFVHNAEFNEKRQKWDPADAGSVRKCSDILKDLYKFKDLEAAFGTINRKAGAWIRHNPAIGANNKDVTRYDHVLVESDSLPIEEQQKLLINLKLPITALIESGGKSVHALVKVDAENDLEYKERVTFLFDYLSQHGFVVDTANKNPARLSRLPGAIRNGNIQRLLATEIGCTSWLDWKDYIDGVTDDLPDPVDFLEQMKNPPQVAPELISGILREGAKCIIMGDSKCGKTCLSQTIAVCIAEGIPWLGKFSCAKKPILYINLEVQEADLFDRFGRIYREMGIKPSGKIRSWNLRGCPVPLEKLAAKVARINRKFGPFGAIFLDPIYKVQTGDENSAEAISKFCLEMDKITRETGASVIYDHHHPKGFAGDRKAIDRGAGSGVWARDADTMIDLSNLDPGNDAADLVRELMDQKEKPMEMSFVLRNFEDQKPLKVWFKFPTHYIDKANLLKDCYIEGSKKANLSKSQNRKSADEKARILEMAFLEASENGLATLKNMIKVSKTSDKTLRKYISESEEYTLKNGVVSRVLKLEDGKIPDVLR